MVSSIPADFQTDLYALYQFTGIFVARAREKCLRGRLDSARDDLRFVRNSRILPLLSHLDEKTFRADVAHLAWKVRQLESECVPRSD